MKTAADFRCTARYTLEDAAYVLDSSNKVLISACKSGDWNFLFVKRCLEKSGYGSWLRKCNSNID